jgi:hypothetical protein
VERLLRNASRIEETSLQQAAGPFEALRRGHFSPCSEECGCSGRTNGQAKIVLTSVPGAVARPRTAAVIGILARGHSPIPLRADAQQGGLWIA